MSTKLSVAVHILSLLDIEEAQSPSSTEIAKSVNTNPVVIRRIMSQLKKAGLIESQPGKKTNKLTKNSSDISLLDVYSAVEGDELPFGIHENTEIKCLVGSQIQQVLEDKYLTIQEQLENSLKDITLSEIVSDIKQKKK